MIGFLKLWFQSLFKKNAVFIFTTHEKIYHIENGKINSESVDMFIKKAKYIENHFFRNELTEMNKLTLFIGKDVLKQINKKIKYD